MPATQTTPRAAPPTLSAVTPGITTLALAHPNRLPQALAAQAGIGLPRARKLVSQLCDAGWLLREGPVNRPQYRPGPLRQVVQRYALDGLEEDRPWRLDFAPCFDLPPAVAEMTQHAFTELLNNAIDHSQGHQVTVSLRQTPTQVQLLVSDNGRGLFETIRQDFAIDDPALAVLELSKGRLTSQPARHTGRGLFYLARLADVMDLHANAVAYQHREWQPQQWVRGRAVREVGSAIYLAIRLDTERRLDEVLRSASLDGEGYDLERAQIPLRLLTSELVALESRAQARRVTARLGQFRQAELDFSGVDRIGHGFADELFRVFARESQGVELVVRHANEAVTRMIAMARAG